MSFLIGFFRPVLIILLWGEIACAADSAKVLVFPLEDLSKIPALAWLSDGIADSISDQIHLPGIRISDYEERSRFIENSDLPPNASLSRASMIRVGQKAGADHIVMGSFSGTQENLRIVVRDLDLKAMKLSGEIIAKGTLATLPQMENELAWLILANDNLNKIYSRERFLDRARTIPNLPFSLYVRGLRTTSESEQVQLFTKAVEMHARFPQAQYFLGRYYYQDGDCAKAVHFLDPAREREQIYLPAEFMLGSCYLQQSNFSDAVQSYSHILAFMRPIEVLNNIGVAYLRAGDLPLAIKNLIEAKSIAKSNPTVALNLALVRHLEGNETAAREVLQEAIKSYPRNGMLQYILSVILRSQGESDKAATALGEAHRLGMEIERLKSEDPKAWARILPVWELVK